MTEPAITPELVAKHNLTPEEYAHAREILGGREPSYTELGGNDDNWIVEDLSAPPETRTVAVEV
jgi:hypothetical protein